MNFALAVAHSNMVASGCPVQLGETDIHCLPQDRDLREIGGEGEVGRWEKWGGGMREWREVGED